MDKVTPSGGVGRVVHRETDPDKRVILPNVDKEGTGNVMVGTLGGGGWEFAEVARLDKRATSVLWPNEKLNISVAKVSSKTLVASKLPQDLAEMTFAAAAQGRCADPSRFYVFRVSVPL